MMQNPDPDPDKIGALFWGVFKPQLIRLALQLDLFSSLAVGPASAAVVAEKCKSSVSPVRALLDHFSSLEILDRNGDEYTLTPTAEAFLLPDRHAFTGDMILHYTSHELWENVLDAVTSGKPRWLGENFVQDAWLESYSVWRIPKSLEMWRAAGVVPRQKQTFRILDLASGCGIKSMAFAQVEKNVHITCLDSPDVLEVAWDLAGRMDISDRVSCMPGDFLQIDLGMQQYDAVLLGQITDYLTTDQNKNLFARINHALAGGGMLIIDCPMAGDLPGEMESLLSLFLWANSGGKAYSYQEYEAWLREAGLGKIEQTSERCLTAIIL